MQYVCMVTSHILYVTYLKLLDLQTAITLLRHYQKGSDYFTAYAMRLKKNIGTAHQII